MSSSKRRSPDRAVCFFGKITFEFFNNEDEDFKARTMKSLAKEVRKEFNLSCLPIEQSLVANPERGTLVLSVAAGSHEKGKEHLNKILAFLDEKAPARIVLEEIEEAEIE